MTRLAMLGVVLLGSLAGCTTYQTIDGETVGRLSLEFVGLIVTAFLLLLGSSGVIAGLSRRWRRRKMKQAVRPPQIRR
jgi:uncharacterized protein YgbK (DUF1537 family)